MVKLEYDKEADAAYVYLKYPLEEGECSTTKKLSEDLIVDFDKSGKLVGIEILNASKVLNKKILAEGAALS